VLDLSNKLLSRFGGLAGVDRAALGELCACKGLGLAKAIQVKAAFELGRRLTMLNPDQRPQVRSPQDAASLLMTDMGRLDQEHFRVLLLNTKNQVLQFEDVYKGSLNASAVRIGEVFRAAIRHNCASIIIAHNHPSGDPTPSPEDVSVTKLVVEAGKLLDIDVLDHLVIGANSFVSLRERGLGFGNS